MQLGAYGAHVLGTSVRWRFLIFCLMVSGDVCLPVVVFTGGVDWPEDVANSPKTSAVEGMRLVIPPPQKKKKKVIVAPKLRLTHRKT